MGMGDLKECFLRIYTLKVAKSGSVHSFGLWEESRWRWVVDLRRRVID